MTPQQKSQIRDIIDNEQWSAVIAAAVAAQDRLRDKVLSIDSARSSDLQLAKARLEGAEAVRMYFENIGKGKNG